MSTESLPHATSILPLLNSQYLFGLIDAAEYTQSLLTDMTWLNAANAETIVVALSALDEICYRPRYRNDVRVHALRQAVAAEKYMCEQLRAEGVDPTPHNRATYHRQLAAEEAARLGAARRPESSLFLSGQTLADLRAWGSIPPSPLQVETPSAVELQSAMKRLTETITGVTGDHGFTAELRVKNGHEWFVYFKGEALGRLIFHKADNLKDEPALPTEPAERTLDL